MKGRIVVGDSTQVKTDNPKSKILDSAYLKILPADLEIVLTNLKKAGYNLIGPKVSEGIITYDQISDTNDLPRGITDSQKSAEYRLIQTDQPHYFSYAVGPHTFKRFTFPPRHILWSIAKDGKNMKLEESVPSENKYAFIGIRPCEIAALHIQDKVFNNDQFQDDHYNSNRKNNFILAVNCTHPAETCFCTSTDSGPSAKEYFDLSMTEVCESEQHFFVIQVGSKLGKSMLRGIDKTDASETEMNIAQLSINNAKANMKRSLPVDGIKELLYDYAKAKNWVELEKRCLSCTSCTMVCPTCFCSTIEDSTNLSGSKATRTRVWDSCFNEDFSYIHGGSVRTSRGTRYRHWITHKLATWQDQFGTLGCVGCGRCITWCPSGIDITEEISRLRKKQIDKKTDLAKE